MKYAINNNTKTPPTKDAKGVCPSCEAEMVAKCGNVKVWHWAHKVGRHCDDWWENETAWHREWKNRFPVKWQERLFKSDGGEKHIADICTDSRLVVEFQHSHIKPEEMAEREAFYENMVWVVDGTRLKNDKPRFLKYVDEWIPTAEDPKKFNVFTEMFPDWVFNKHWVDRPAPVFFDFGETDESDIIKNKLWCVLPKGNRDDYIFAQMQKSDFVQMVGDDELFAYLRRIFKTQLKKDEERKQQREDEAQRIIHQDKQQTQERIQNALKSLERLRSKKYALELKQQMQTHSLWHYISPAMQENLKSLPDFVVAEVPDGDWIFGCARQVWQVAFYQQFVLENQKAFSIRHANDWLQTNGCVHPPVVGELYTLNKDHPDAFNFKPPNTLKSLTAYCEHLCNSGVLADATYGQKKERWFKTT